jgi:hypothetical protein
MGSFNWERNWCGAGVVFAVLIIVASVIYGSQPKVGASADKLVSFYDGDRTRILIATVFFCFSFLELLWFGAALSSVCVMPARAAGPRRRRPRAQRGLPFGLRRAGIISKRFFAAGVAAVVLVLLGGTTLARNGFWAPDGAYALVSEVAWIVWIVVLSGFLAMRPSAAPAPERVPVAAA